MEFQVKADRLDLKTDSIFAFDQDTWSQIATVVERDIIRRILRGEQTNKEPIKKNSPSWQDRKRALGRSGKSLINDPNSHRFIQKGGGSYRIKRYIKKRKSRGYQGAVIGFTKRETERIAMLLQRRGYTGWFGLSDAGARAVLRLFRQELKTQLDKVVAKGSGRFPSLAPKTRKKKGDK